MVIFRVSLSQTWMKFHKWVEGGGKYLFNPVIVPRGKFQSPPKFKNFSLRRVAESLRMESHSYLRPRSDISDHQNALSSRPHPGCHHHIPPKRQMRSSVPSGSPHSQMHPQNTGQAHSRNEQQGSAPHRGDTGCVRVPHSFSRNYSPCLTCSFLGQFRHNINYPGAKGSYLSLKKGGKK